MKRLALAAAATLLVFPAFAQSTITLDDIEINKNKPVAAAQTSAVQELEDCLLDQSGCKKSKFNSAAKFSIDDVVNLGVIDRTKVKSAGAAGGSQSAAALPSIDMEILFDYNSADLRQDQYSKLAELSQVLRGDKFDKFSLLFLGHSDAKGSATYNRTLSQQRAQSVASFISSISKISTDRILTTGLGASKLKDVADPFGAQNRRVQLVLIPVK